MEPQTQSCGSAHGRASSDKPPLRVRSLQGSFDNITGAWRGVLHKKCKIHPSYLKKNNHILLLFDPQVPWTLGLVVLVDVTFSVGSWAEIHVRERMLFVWVEDRLSLGWFVSPLLSIYERNLKCRVEIVQRLAQVDDGNHLSLNPPSEEGSPAQDCRS